MESGKEAYFEGEYSFEVVIGRCFRTERARRQSGSLARVSGLGNP